MVAAPNPLCRLGGIPGSSIFRSPTVSIRGIRQIGVLTQYKAHSLILHLQRGWSFYVGNW